MIKNIIYKMALFVIVPYFLMACNKDGNPLPSSFKLICSINGETYIDQMPVLLPPGVKRTPYIDFKMSGNRYMEFYSSLRNNSHIERQETFELQIVMPVNKEFELEKQYEFTQIEKNEFVANFNSDNSSKEQTQYVAIRSSDEEMWHYGTGMLKFTEFDISTQIAKGEISFTFPSMNEKDYLKLDGKFECWINTLD